MQAAYECRGVGGQELGGDEAAQEGTAVFEVALLESEVGGEQGEVQFVVQAQRGAVTRRGALVGT